MKQVYLAGPDVFRPDALARGEELKALCLKAGIAGLYPLDGSAQAEEGPAEIRARCIAHLHQCQGVVANISPFRGLHMDPGTAWEIGYAQARGLPVFLWSDDPRPLLERFPAVVAGTGHRDADGYLLEDFGQPENLMISPPGTRVFASAKDAIRAAAGALGSDAPPMPALGLGWKIAVALGVAYAVSFVVNRWVGW